MKNPKFEKVHPVADRKLVSEFDPETDKADRWIFEKVLEKPKHHPPKLDEKHTPPNSKLSHSNNNTEETNALPKPKEKLQSPMTISASINRKHSSRLSLLV